MSVTLNVWHAAHRACPTFVWPPPPRRHRPASTAMRRACQRSPPRPCLAPGPPHAEAARGAPRPLPGPLGRPWPPPQVAWFVVADDDTLLSVPRLLDALSLLDPDTPVFAGERSAPTPPPRPKSCAGRKGTGFVSFSKRGVRKGCGLSQPGIAQQWFLLRLLLSFWFFWGF